MIVVSDTSPILNLSAIGRLQILRDLFSQIILPPSVADELARHGIQPDLTWMLIVSAQNRIQFTKLLKLLDPGEAEAIIVALELKASLILIDEQRGRRIAAERGLNYMGLLGVLLEAKARGVIPACKPILDQIIQEAGFWIGNNLRSRFLLATDEQP